MTTQSNSEITITPEELIHWGEPITITDADLPPLTDADIKIANAPIERRINPHRDFSYDRIKRTWPRGNAPKSMEYQGISTSEGHAPDKIQVLFEKKALAKMTDLLEKNSTVNGKRVETAGIVIGTNYVDAKGKPTVQIDEYIQIPEKFLRGRQSSAHVAFSADAWSYLNKQIDKRYPGKRMLGWAHTHPGLGVFLSQDDMFVESTFQEDHHIAVVYDPIRSTKEFGKKYNPESSQFAIFSKGGSAKPGDVNGKRTRYTSDWKSTQLHRGFYVYDEEREKAHPEPVKRPVEVKQIPVKPVLPAPASPDKPKHKATQPIPAPVEAKDRPKTEPQPGVQKITRSAVDTLGWNQSDAQKAAESLAEKTERPRLEILTELQAVLTRMQIEQQMRANLQLISSVYGMGIPVWGIPKFTDPEAYAWDWLSAGGGIFHPNGNKISYLWFNQATSTLCGFQGGCWYAVSNFPALTYHNALLVPTAPLLTSTAMLGLLKNNANWVDTYGAATFSPWVCAPLMSARMGQMLYF